MAVYFGSEKEQGSPCSQTSHAVMDGQWNPDFSNLQGKLKLVRKNRVVREIGGNLTVFDRGEVRNSRVGEIEISLYM